MTLGNFRADFFLLEILLKGALEGFFLRTQIFEEMIVHSCEFSKVSDSDKVSTDLSCLDCVFLKIIKISWVYFALLCVVKKQQKNKKRRYFYRVKFLILLYLSLRKGE